MSTNGIHVCTLFEGAYHFGVGALVNSLERRGYRGPVWAGFRGALPPWAKTVEVSAGRYRMAIHESLSVEFLRLDTPAHFTNYKPAFMLELLRRHAEEMSGLVYLDPDIIIKCKWAFIEEWTSFGVALCEDVNSPMPANHPLRMMWRRFAEERNFDPANETLVAYFNGGFVGVRAEFIAFLEEWNNVLEAIGDQIGGLDKWDVVGREHPFNKTDQDALNIAAMYTRQPLTTMGREGMDFRSGGWTMAHSIGSPKPWAKNLIWQSLRGRKPSSADRLFFQHVSGPIPVYSRIGTARSSVALFIASALGRCFGR
jgi:hypothetical protein